MLVPAFAFARLTDMLYYSDTGEKGIQVSGLLICGVDKTSSLAASRMRDVGHTGVY